MAIILYFRFTIFRDNSCLINSELKSIKKIKNANSFHILRFFFCYFKFRNYSNQVKIIKKVLAKN